VNTADPILDRVARELASVSERDRPAVSASWAQTLNGAISRDKSAPTPISSTDSLILTHRLRTMHAAVLVGVGTVLSDDPLLSVRLVEGPQPQPIVLDSSLRTPPACRLMGRGDIKPWIFHSSDGGMGSGLSAGGARLFRIGRREGGLDLREVVSILAENGIPSLLVEGGGGVLCSFFLRGLIRQAVITISPSIMRGFAPFNENNLPPDVRLVDAIWESRGRDVIVWGKILPEGL
jgi:GTP cyclohydrolase II